MKNTKRLVKISKKRPPLGTKRNPWHIIKGMDWRIHYFRFTPYGIWMVEKPPKNSIVVKDTDDGN